MGLPLMQIFKLLKRLTLFGFLDEFDVFDLDTGGSLSYITYKKSLELSHCWN